jgi:hypothetical protein
MSGIFFEILLSFEGINLWIEKEFLFKGVKQTVLIKFDFMIKATYKDKYRVIEILAALFDDNQSVNYISKQGKKRNERIRKLMAYSYEVCYLFRNVFLSDDKKACALILYPDKKRTTLKSICN